MLRWLLTVVLPSLSERPFTIQDLETPGGREPGLFPLFGWLSLDDLMLLAVNTVGALLLGILVGIVPLSSARRRLFWGTGFLGGFTSFSSLSAMLLGLSVRITFQPFQEPDSLPGPLQTALMLALISLVAGIVAAGIGLKLGRDVRGFARSDNTQEGESHA